MSLSTTNQEPAATAIERRLSATGGTEPEHATRVDMMHAMVQLAREQLSGRGWAAERAVCRRLR